jgi:hypothetical protein
VSDVDVEGSVAGHDGLHVLGLDPGGQGVVARALLLHGALAVGRLLALRGRHLEDVVGRQDDLDVLGVEAAQVARELDELAVVRVDLVEAVRRLQVVRVGHAAHAVRAVLLRDLEREYALVQDVLDRVQVHVRLQVYLSLEFTVNFAFKNDGKFQLLIEIFVPGQMVKFVKKKERFPLFINEYFLCEAQKR